MEDFLEEGQIEDTKNMLIRKAKERKQEKNDPDRLQLWISGGIAPKSVLP